ncbi:MAG: hypothetical protein KTR31_10605 [Myxococcales bacterium]|nr:hypothetical protein [Myxococcales bacterium]
MTTIRISCSPDADDLFMMRALLEQRIDTGPYRFEIGTSPTDALNRLAAGKEAPEVIALSIAHYPAVSDRYLLLPHGGSLGEGYGPVVVSDPTAQRVGSIADLRTATIGVPGLTTTAWLVLRLILGPDHQARPVVIPIEPPSRIFEAVRDGEVDAGLVIHEGRLTFADEGTVSVVDLGVWWAEQTGGLPLPLGGNAIRRDLGPEVVAEVSDLLRQSIAHGLEHRDEAIAWLMRRGTALGSEAQIGEYLDMYANQRTLDYGPEGRQGVEELFRRAVAADLLQGPVEVEWAS